MPPIPSPATITKAVSAGWAYNTSSQILSKTFTFSGGYLPTIAFLTQLSLYSHKVQHHPEIVTKYNVVTLNLTTDDENSVTDKDVKMANKADKLFNQLK